MSEMELLALARSTTQNQVAMLGGVLTITFAMVVAIYYFLNRANLTMKVFAFLAYMMGVFLLLGQMLVESNIKAWVLEAMRGLPSTTSAVVQHYVALNDSWLVHATAALFNGAFWVLSLGTFYLLFFWRPGHSSDKAGPEHRSE